MEQRKIHIAIIGAGIGGLMAAIALLRANIKVEIFEQATQLSEVGLDPRCWEADGLFSPTSKPRPLMIEQFSEMFGVTDLSSRLLDEIAKPSLTSSPA